MGNKRERDQFIGEIVTDERFEYINTFDLIVPADYNHEHQLDAFAEKNKKEFYAYNKNITDRNFAKVSHKLIPGKTYKVKIYDIKSVVTSEECLSVYLANKAYFVGAQGASVVWQEKKEELTDGKWSISFDEKNALWMDYDGYYSVPRVGRYSIETWLFDIGVFESDWYDDNALLVFCDCDEST